MSSNVNSSKGVQVLGAALLVALVFIGYLLLA